MRKQVQSSHVTLKCNDIHSRADVTGTSWLRESASRFTLAVSSGRDLDVEKEARGCSRTPSSRLYWDQGNS